ncbi:hypothetical protein KKA09_02075 [Patescibacteria group bacterium]|nr:hypothetical protein [Patescibacteria group bacterium]
MFKHKFVVFLLVIFVVMGVAGFWYWQTNVYSKDVLKIEILSDEAVDAGQEIEYLVKLKNNGNIRLENPELVFQPPEHSILVGSTSSETSGSLIAKKTMEDIYPGEERTYSFRVRVFGRENENLVSQALLSYQPKDLTRRYESKTTFTTKIKSVPLTLEFDLPSKIEQSEDVDFSLNYFSNLDYPLENLRIKIKYPSGFEFVSASPKPFLDETNEWKISSLFQANGGRIKIKGKITGEQGEQKTFHASIGVIKDGAYWVLKETNQAVEIAEPSFYISQLINNSPNYIAKAGELLHYEIFFKNMGQKPITKKFLFLSLGEDFFDISSLKSETGEHGMGDNTIIWDWKTRPDLRFLDANQEGKEEFWVKVKEIDSESIKTKNPVLRNEIGLGGIKKIFETKLNSQIEFSQKVLREQEFFENLGILPPIIGEKTEYVVLWQIKNSWNNLSNVKVKAILPQNVRLTGKIFPENASFTFDSESKEVIWNVGEMEGLKYSGDNPLKLAFQIEFTPDPSLQGKTAVLIEEAEVMCQDVWTSAILQEKSGLKNTALQDDPTIIEGQGIVQ